jgi:hypothetical protein
MRLLTDFPMIGHEGALQGNREMVVPGLPYIRLQQSERDCERRDFQALG